MSGTLTRKELTRREQIKLKGNEWIVRNLRECLACNKLMYALSYVWCKVVEIM